MTNIINYAKILIGAEIMAEIWFTADTHFNHDNIREHCNRPFDNADEMDETLITNWNSLVKKKI